MDKNEVRKLWLKSKEYKTIFILDMIIFIFAIVLIIFVRMDKLNDYATIILSLIIFISVNCTRMLLIKRADKFYSKYGINIRERKYKKNE